ncbi:hypothetical protein D9M73_67050 [compost metagenome]
MRAVGADPHLLRKVLGRAGIIDRGGAQTVDIAIIIGELIARTGGTGAGIDIARAFRSGAIAGDVIAVVGCISRAAMLIGGDRGDRSRAEIELAGQIVELRPVGIGQHHLGRGFVGTDRGVPVRRESVGIFDHRHAVDRQVGRRRQACHQATACRGIIVDVLALEVGVVDIAIAVAAIQHRAHGQQVFDQRHVDHALDEIVQAPAIGASHLRFDLALIILGRFVEEDADRAAHRTRAVQGALRSAQHLDAVDVEQGEIGGAAGGVARYADRAGDRRVVIINADRRFP